MVMGAYKVLYSTSSEDRVLVFINLSRKFRIKQVLSHRHDLTRNRPTGTVRTEPKPAALEEHALPRGHRDGLWR